MGRTQEERKAETRQRLLAAAAGLFASDGFDAVSVDAIGAAADRTSGAVYAHFGNKQGLMSALLEEFQDDLAAVVMAEFATRGTLSGRLLGLWQSFATQADPGGASWFLLEMELWIRASRDPEIAERLANRYDTVRGYMRAEFTEWVDHHGLTPPVPVAELPQAIFAVLVGMQMQRSLDPSVVSDDHALSVLLALFGADPSLKRDL